MRLSGVAWLAEAWAAACVAGTLASITFLRRAEIRRRGTQAVSFRWSPSASSEELYRLAAQGRV